MRVKPDIVFICIKNAGRSQMAAAFAREISGGSLAIASAGSDPGVEIHPEVREVMSEVGIDLSDQKPTSILEAAPAGARVVVTMGCGDTCPTLSAERRIEWDIEDPSGKPLSTVREIRDSLKAKVAELLESLEPFLQPGTGANL